MRLIGLCKCFVAGLVALCTPQVAGAAERVAMVIGNSDYAEMRVLPNARNDARLLHETLTKMGFDAGSAPRMNLTKREMERALRDFSAKASTADIAVIYYAGHGMEATGSNFLIPADAELASDEDTQYESVPLSMVMQALDGVKGLGLVLLDACRDDPFRNSSRRVFRNEERPGFRGLVRSGPLNNVAVVFAAQLGAVASDGEGRNSPFASSLAMHLPTPGLELGEMLARVGKSVETKTENQQSPDLDVRPALLTGKPLVEPIAGQSQGNDTTVKSAGIVILDSEPPSGSLKSGTVVYVRNQCSGGNLMKVTGGSNRNSAGERIPGASRKRECVPGSANW